MNSFDEVRAELEALPPLDEGAVAAVRRRDATLVKPPGSLGELQQIVEWLAACQGRANPTLAHPLVCLFAANHGVARRGVSPYPAEVTQQMVANFAAGGAAINQIARVVDVPLKVVEISLTKPTEDFTVAPAMTEVDCVEAIVIGMNAMEEDVDLLCLGEMGIGNTTAAAAVYTALYGGSAGHWAGRGTGHDAAGLKRKHDAIEAGLALHLPHLFDPLEILRRLGGREIAALFGAILAARRHRVPVVLDGYIVTAAAALLHALAKGSLDHCLAGHLSAEGAHADVLRRLDKTPLLDLGLRLGEGTGAALAVGVVRAALACHTGMATFAEAGVSDRG